MKLHQHDLPARLMASELQEERKKFVSPMPALLSRPPLQIQVVDKEALGAASDVEQIKEQFPHTFGKPRVELQVGTALETINNALRVGVVLSGGQAPGGHNVIAGLFDGIRSLNPGSVLFGFLNGPKGIFTGEYCEITPAAMDSYRNTGGFDMICSGRDKIETPEQFSACKEVCDALNLDGLVVIGGDDSNTNAAVLAEYFMAQGSKTKVCGCPKTIDGDLKNEYIPVSFGFDTACRVFSEQISNICSDVLASQKYWHFVRLMGRSASSIALECALQTRPNVCLIGEEVAAKKQGLASISQEIAQLVVDRFTDGRAYGVVLLPEGLIEFMPEFMALIAEINDVLAAGTPANPAKISQSLSKDNAVLFDYLPASIQTQLVLDRDPHGNVQVSLIETEKLLASTVATELKARNFEGKFDPQFAFCGYEGRSALPSPFDATYTYVIGRVAALLIANNLTALMVSVTDLEKPVSEWRCGGVPITMMCGMEKRKGKFKPVIQKALVELTGPRAKPFEAFASRRALWATVDAYRCVGPLQLDAEVELCRTLQYELCGIVDNDQEGEQALQKVVQTTSRIGNFHFTPLSRDSLSRSSAARLDAPIGVPSVASSIGEGLHFNEPTRCARSADANLIQGLFPSTHARPMVELVSSGSRQPTPSTAQRVGVVFCGRQAPGAHNIVCGLYNALTTQNPDSKLLGFVFGSKGLFSKTFVEVTADLAASYRNQGGMHMLGRSADHIRGQTELEKVASVCVELDLDALVLVGGARTHTDAAYLAEHLASNSIKTAIIGCPTGIGGEMMRATFVDCTVGFDTHCRVSAEMIGNTATDGASNRKYYYFIRLNAGGHMPSHVVLEAALQTQPTYTLLTEEVIHGNKSLRDISNEIADVVSARSKQGKNFGLVLMPEGLLASIPELRGLLDELDGIAASHRLTSLSLDKVSALLTPWALSLLHSLPEFAQSQLLLDRQSDGRVDLAKVDTERLVAHFVEDELARRKKAGSFNGKFAVITSIRSSQARSAVPTQFDCELGYAVGLTAAVLAMHSLNGYFVAVTGLHRPVSEWRLAGAPITTLLAADGAEFLENGTSVRPRVVPAPIQFESAGYAAFEAKRHQWALEELNINPGPVQFSGSTRDLRAKTVSLAQNNYIDDLSRVWQLIEDMRMRCRPGCDRNALVVTSQTLNTLHNIMSLAGLNSGVSGSHSTKSFF